MLRRGQALSTSNLLLTFGLAMLLPAVAVVWLGWRLVDQDGGLERQRVQEVADAAATGVTAAMERQLGAIERALGRADATHEDLVSSGGVSVRVDGRGNVAMVAGPPLLFVPDQPAATDEPPARVWVEGERMEFVAGNHGGAAVVYQALAASTDRATRAGALIRLARVFRRSGRADDALGVYATLAGTSDARILGDPADLMARWARVELLDGLGRSADARREAEALDADLHAARWPLARATALAYLDALRPWRSDAAESARAERVRLGDAVAAVWSTWRARPSFQPFADGRRPVRVGEHEVLVVWREVGSDLFVYAAPPASLARLSGPGSAHVAVALVDVGGHTVAGDTPSTPGLPVVIRPSSDTGLPWTVRIAITDMPTEIAAAGAFRRRTMAAGLLLIALLLPATGLVVARAVTKELALARQQTTFVSAVSHEFRSPLTTLTHLTSLLRSDFQPTDERRRQYYDMLASETDRLRRFVDTLLDVGRIQAGGSRYRLAPIDPRAVVERVVDEFRRYEASGSREISLIVPGPVPFVSADAEALGRALWNLLENAAKYSPQSRPVVVRLEPDGDRVVIRVIDQGVGIPEDERPLVFDHFYRGAAATNSAVTGTGIGLALVRHIVKAHGGVITLDSAVGTGSTFSIVLPAIDATAPAFAARHAS